MVKMRRKPGADAVMFARPTLISASIFIKPPAENADCEGEETSRYGFDSKLLQRSFKTILFTQIPMTAMSIISSMLYAKWWRIEGHRQDWQLSCPSTLLEGRLSTIYAFVKVWIVFAKFKMFHNQLPSPSPQFQRIALEIFIDMTIATFWIQKHCEKKEKHQKTSSKEFKRRKSMMPVHRKLMTKEYQRNLGWRR